MSGISDVREDIDGLRAQIAAFAGLSSQYAALGMSSAGQAAQIAAMQAQLASLAASSPQILTGVFTVADTAKTVEGVSYQPLPAPADNVGKYARVIDLFGMKSDLVLASKVGATSFWQPVRPDFASKVAAPADLTFYAVRNPNICIVTGALPGLGLFRTLTLSPTMAFPGAKFRIKNTMTGLGTLRIGNVNLGTPLSIILGATQEFAYDMTDGWVQIT